MRLDPWMTTRLTTSAWSNDFAKEVCLFVERVDQPAPAPAPAPAEPVIAWRWRVWQTRPRREFEGVCPTVEDAKAAAVRAVGELLW